MISTRRKWLNLAQVNVENVHAELVRASQTTIRALDAEELDASEVIMGTASTGKLSGRRAIFGAVNAKQAELQQAVVGGLRGETVSLNGKAGVVIAHTLNSSEANGLVIGAGEVNATSIRAGLLIGRQVNGPVETLLDGRTALVAGVVGGMAAGLILLAGRLLFGRKK